MYYFIARCKSEGHFSLFWCICIGTGLEPPRDSSQYTSDSKSHSKMEQLLNYKHDIIFFITYVSTTGQPSLEGNLLTSKSMFIKKI